MWGGARLRKAVGKSQSSSFWDLRLPVETRRHVAKLLALSRVVLSPEQHGLVLPELKTNQLSQNQTSQYQPWFQDACCDGRAMEISTVNRMKAVDIQRQLLSPPIWKTQPDNIVPIRRPMAFAM